MSGFKNVEHPSREVAGVGFARPPNSGQLLSSQWSRATTQGFLVRLHTLLAEITSVLRAYAPSIQPQASRLRWLHSFYDRVIDHLDQIQGIDVRNDESGNCLRRGDCLEAVTWLEGEWRQSEFHAAWYGPTRATRERALAGPTGQGADEVEIKADWKYVGLYDEGRRE